MQKLLSITAGATFNESSPNLNVGKAYIEIIFKLKATLYAIINMMVVYNETALLFVNLDKFFNRLQNPTVQLPKVKKNCPKLYAIMQGTDSDQGHIVRDGEELNGFCMAVHVQGSFPIIARLIEDVFNAVEILVNKNLDIYNEFYKNPPCPAWKLGIEEVWNKNIMAWNYITTCPKCGHKFHVSERPLGVPGGKEKEDIDRPWCEKTVDQKMTDGWFETSKIEE